MSRTVDMHPAMLSLDSSVSPNVIKVIPEGVLNGSVQNGTKFCYEKLTKVEALKSSERQGHTIFFKVTQLRLGRFCRGECRQPTDDSARDDCRVAGKKRQGIAGS